MPPVLRFVEHGFEVNDDLRHLLQRICKFSKSSRRSIGIGSSYREPPSWFETMWAS
jgi:hypothetical protein